MTVRQSSSQQQQAVMILGLKPLLPFLLPFLNYPTKKKALLQLHLVVPGNSESASYIMYMSDRIGGIWDSAESKSILQNPFLNLRNSNPYSNLS